MWLERVNGINQMPGGIFRTNQAINNQPTKIRAMKPQLTLFLILICICFNASAQNHGHHYPIGENPDIKYIFSSYNDYETILFEANPTVRFNVYNNFELGMMEHPKHTQAWYIAARPQLRMYTENSRPVKTPSYRMYFGTQHLFRLVNNKYTKQKHYTGFSLESGHYSNGQAGCSFSTRFEDGSVECDNIYSSINSSMDLSKSLNRTSGNFSTNQTEVILNYRIYTLDRKGYPRKMHSFNLGYNLYHKKFLGILNFGEYSDNDIKIYGRHRYLLGYEFMIAFKEEGASRLSITQNFEIIQGAHNHVQPIRSESKFTFYPFTRSKAFGAFASYIYGHDNYNYRFVDSGHQITIGFTWDQFPPLVLPDRIAAQNGQWLNP